MIMLVRNELEKLECENRQRLEIIRNISVTLEPTETTCPLCRGKMRVQQTYPNRQIATVKYGPLYLRVVILVCNKGCRSDDGNLITRKPEMLAKVVALGAKFGYDVEVFAGLQKYLYNWQREEIQAYLLREYGISISTGKISDLQRRFLKHYSALIDQRIPELRKALGREGKYPWWVDATGECGRGTLFLVRGGWEQWVIGSWQLISECVDQILPCLKQVATRFGAPAGIMRDLGTAIIPAVIEFTAGFEKEILIWSCHQHFLKDIGKDLLSDSYDKLRGFFRKYGMKSKLRFLVRDWGKKLGKQAKDSREEIREWAEQSIRHELPTGTTGLATLRTWVQWILDFEDEGKNLRFPFDRPHLDFYNRCLAVRRALDACMRSGPNDSKNLRSIRRLAAIIDPTITDERFQETTQILSKRANLFDEMRMALRLNPKITARAVEGSSLTEKEKAEFTKSTKKSLNKFTRLLRKRRPKRGPGQDIRVAIDIILGHIDRHGDSLWDHVITLSDGNIRVVGRTNIPAEGFFNALKHNERRRSGRKNLGQDMEDLPPEAALVANLKHKKYVQILCGSLDKLPEAFATLDAQPVQKPQEEEIIQVERASLSRNDQKFVRQEFIGEKIMAAASSRAPRIEVSAFC